MFIVIFKDKFHGLSIETFEDFDNAVEYWNEYAETDTCEKGILLDLDSAEIIWKF